MLAAGSQMFPALAGLFLLAGGSKLAGAPATVTLLEAIGVGQWIGVDDGIRTRDLQGHNLAL